MVRLLVEDVTLLKSKKVVTACVRLRGGSTKTLTVASPVPVYERHKTPTHVVAEVDRLLDAFTDAQIAGVLNGRGLRSAEGKSFTALIVRHIRLVYHLKSRHDRLREAGMLTRDEIARELKISLFTVKAWRAKGWLPAHAYNDHGGYLYEPPGEHCPAKYKSEEKKKTRRGKANLTWAALIRRVFEVDPLRCSCGGELEIVEFYTDGHECADYLEHCGLPVETADPKPARSPPELEDFAEPDFEDYVEPEPPDEWYGIDAPFHED